MMNHNICFEGLIWNIIPKFSLLPLLEHRPPRTDSVTVVSCKKGLQHTQKIRKQCPINIIWNEGMHMQVSQSSMKEQNIISFNLEHNMTMQLSDRRG